MPVHNCPGWPLYQTEDGIYIRAIKIASLKIELDGTGIAYFDDGYSPQHLSQAFLTVAKPEEGCYLFSSGYGELLYMGSERFEATCTRCDKSTDDRVARCVDEVIFDQPDSYSDMGAALMALKAQHNELIQALKDARLMQKE